VPGAAIGVYVHDLATDERVTVNADSLFHAASTMKIAVLIELFRRVDAGALSLDSGITVVNQFASIVDGSPYTLDPGDDSDSSMYARAGTRVPLRELAEHMITRSSNLATNLLIALLDPRRVDATAHMLGVRRMRVYRGVEDGKAFRQGLNNVTTAADLGALLEAIEQGRAASAASCAAMREILLRQEDNAQIPAGLPSGTPVAHKTGQITGVLHDAAVVYPPGRLPYVLVVLTRDIPDEAVARALIVDVTRLVHARVMAR
jgi:beta-lactamase class A